MIPIIVLTLSDLYKFGMPNKVTPFELDCAEF